MEPYIMHDSVPGVSLGFCLQGNFWSMTSPLKREFWGSLYSDMENREVSLRIFKLRKAPWMQYVMHFP